MIFSKKAESNNSLPLTFNETEVRACQSQKHPGLILDERLNFTEQINSKINKCDKLIEIIKKLYISFPRDELLRTCNFFLADLILIMVILSIINRTIRHLKTK